MPAEPRGPRPGRRPPPRTPRPATRAEPDPRLTRSRRPRARPSRTLSRVRFTASSPVGSEETAELDRHLETAQRRAAKPGTDPHPDFTGRWIVPKETHNSEAETSSLCVFCRKSVRAKNEIVETTKVFGVPPQSVLSLWPLEARFNCSRRVRVTFSPAR